MDNIKAQLKAIFDAAQELKAGGETVHNIYGEMSISLERIAKLVTKEGEWKMEDWNKYIYKPFLEKSEKLLNKLYDNQRDTRKFILMIIVILCITVILVFLLQQLPKTPININFCKASL